MLKCDTCGNVLSIVKGSFEMAKEDITILPCITCCNKSFEAGEIYQAKIFIKMTKEKAND